ncbi:Dipeptide transport system permease protein DppB [subsurface metagenome]
MLNYIIRRLLLVIPTVFLVSVIIFFMMRFIPGDMIDVMVSEWEAYRDIDRATIEQALGLDVPVLEQYGRWIGFLRDKDGNFSGIFQGSLGVSFWKQTPVVGEIVSRLPVTIELAILAMLTQLIVALPIGVYSAMRQDTAGDYAGRSFATLLIALPNFWAGIMIILLASLFLGVAPLLKPISFIKDPIRNLGQFIVPAFILGMAGTGTIMRMTRSMVLEVLRQDYIRTAWAKGLRERVVLMRHTLRNALIPVVTQAGGRTRTMIGGAIIIETVFSLPGIGRLLVDAINYRDYTMVSGIIFFFAGFLMLVNLLVDLTYGYIDPRIHYK